MPCHPDRVRRNYHKIVMNEIEDVITNDIVVTIRVSKREIASAMSAREVEHNVWRAIQNGIRLRWAK
jgi:hypothetical protein